MQRAKEKVGEDRLELCVQGDYEQMKTRKMKIVYFALKLRRMYNSIIFGNPYYLFLYIFKLKERGSVKKTMFIRFITMLKRKKQSNQ